MSKSRVVVHSTRTSEEARRVALSLVALDLRAEVGQGTGEYSGVWIVTVDEGEEDAASALVRDALAERREVMQPAAPPLLDTRAGIWTYANTSSSIALAAICIGIHVLVHGGAGPSSRSQMIDAGVSATWLVQDGQWWRLLSAVFLHFDVKHVVGNMSTLFFLGAPLVAQIGHLRMVLVFVITGLGGNLASLIFGSEAAIKAGASGGICGLLGALAGVALAQMSAASNFTERRPAWQTLGALLALFGMVVGFEPGRDHYAHVGGLLTGVALGWLLAPTRTAPAAEEDATNEAEVTA